MLLEIPEGWGAYFSFKKWQFQRGGEFVSEILTVVGVWIFSFSRKVKLFFYQISLQTNVVTLLSNR